MLSQTTERVPTVRPASWLEKRCGPENRDRPGVLQAGGPVGLAAALERGQRVWPAGGAVRFATREVGWDGRGIDLDVRDDGAREIEDVERVILQRDSGHLDPRREVRQVDQADGREKATASRSWATTGQPPSGERSTASGMGPCGSALRIGNRGRSPHLSTHLRPCPRRPSPSGRRTRPARPARPPLRSHRSSCRRSRRPGADRSEARRGTRTGGSFQGHFSSPQNRSSNSSRSSLLRKSRRRPIARSGPSWRAAETGNRLGWPEARLCLPHWPARPGTQTPREMRQRPSSGRAPIGRVVAGEDAAGIAGQHLEGAALRLRGLHRGVDQ